MADGFLAPRSSRGSRRELAGCKMPAQSHAEEMSMRGLKWIAATAFAVVGGVLLIGCGSRGPSLESGTAQIKTPWGEPDLQGIWTMEFDTPLQGPARFR